MTRNISITTSFMDYPDNNNCCLTIFMSGCEHGCKNCHNKQLQNPLYNKGMVKYNPVSLSIELEDLSKKHRTNKVAIMGGDPLFKPNIEFVKGFLTLNSTLEKKFDIIIYTGYDIKYVKKNNVKGFKFVKCGLYDEKKKIDSKKTDNYIQFASSNQKLYNGKNRKVSRKGKHKF